MTELEPAFEGLLQQTMAPISTRPSCISTSQQTMAPTNTGPSYSYTTANSGLPTPQLEHETSPTNTPSNSGLLLTSPIATNLVPPFSQASSITNHQPVVAGPSSVIPPASNLTVEKKEDRAGISSQQVNTVARSEAATDFTGTALHKTRQTGFSGPVEGHRSALEQDGPPAKRAKVMTGDFSDGGGGGFFPTDQDIDDFLDKLHQDSNCNDNDSD